MKRILIAFICLIFLQSTNKAQTIIKTKKPGTLEQVLSQEQQDTCRYLAVEGNVNSADVRLLRRMAGYKEDGFRTGKLHIIDLRKCTFITDKNPFMELDAKKESLAGTAFPQKFTQKGKGQAVTGITSFPANHIFYVIQKYEPVFFLNQTDPNREMKLKKRVLHQDGLYSKIFYSEGYFHFAEGITQTQWKDIKKKYEIDTFTGHEIVQQEEQYIMKVHTKKGNFFHDTFYKCPNLKIVFLPKKIKTDASVFDMSSKITYYKDDKIFDWNKEYWSSYLPQE